ncbi:MAG: hypothetical protein ABI423_02450 [Burkholderiales bacterium]
MISTAGALRRHRYALAAKIAAQRLRLERELGDLRGPLLAFEVARGLGEALRRHAALAALIATGAALLLFRGGLLARARHALRLAARAVRWWMLARLGWRRLRQPA